MRTRANLIPRPNCETRKTKTQHMRNKNSTRFYCKEEKKHNKAMIRKCAQN
jgi:hypothetical protein